MQQGPGELHSGREFRYNHFIMNDLFYLSSSGDKIASIITFKPLSICI